MSSRPFFLLPLCFVSALALNAYAALDPTGVYQDYLEKLDAATPPVAAMATAAADGVYPWSEPKAPEPPPVPDPAPLPDPEPEPEPEEPDSPFTTVDASSFDDALLIGDSSVLATGLLLIPITILLAYILPGNEMLPFADLASLVFILALVTPFVRRNMF